jgi:hypothetical protein
LQAKPDLRATAITLFDSGLKLNLNENSSFSLTLLLKILVYNENYFKIVAA